MKYIQAVNWQPADGMHLEPNALTAVNSAGNVLVVAGPGAGKTELLAQRASYLLQTNTCTAPGRILAISFKRDAAVNLTHRVKLRCGDALSARFDSFTFDAFAKQLLDRFKHALPEQFQLNNGYEIFFNDAPITDLYRDFDLVAFNTQNTKMLINLLTRHSYPLQAINALEQLAERVLQALLSKNPAKINFRILMRLAELIVQTNPKIKKYLHQTYQYVFLDEFQDTTEIQYSFLKSCFFHDDSETVFTAVGDDKQRIMLWAGAKENIFEEFITDTGAMRLNLQMNFRSAPRLVELQNHLMQTLLGSTDTVIPSAHWLPDAGKIDFYAFKTLDEEKAFLYTSINQWIAVDQIKPRDIVLLVKQRLNLYAGDIITYLNEKGIKARDENELQDLLSEEMVGYIINMLYALYKKNAAKEKESAFNFLSIVNSEFEDSQLMKLNRQLILFLDNLKKKYPVAGISVQDLHSLVDEIILFADFNRIKSVFSQYKDRNFATDIVAKVKKSLEDYFSQSNDIQTALDLLMGVDCVPVMTVHKSKGLEYHSVVFVGFEDGAFWSFKDQAEEDKRTFFVALSRAKERVVFTFCKQRKDKYGNLKTQSLVDLRVIFDSMNNSGLLGFHSIGTT